jgi:hypothetical protein
LVNRGVSPTQPHSPPPRPRRIPSSGTSRAARWASRTTRPTEHLSPGMGQYLDRSSGPVTRGMSSSAAQGCSSVDIADWSYRDMWCHGTLLPSLKEIRFEIDKVLSEKGHRPRMVRYVALLYRLVCLGPTRCVRGYNSTAARTSLAPLPRRTSQTLENGLSSCVIMSQMYPRSDNRFSPGWDQTLGDIPARTSVG